MSKSDKKREKYKTILITGSGGFLGKELIRQLSLESEYKTIALTSNKKQLLSEFDYIKQLEIFGIDDWKRGELPFERVDILLHCAFSRNSDGQELVESLNFMNALFIEAIEKGIPGIVNISSQSVYGNINKPLWSENMSVSPSNLYSLAKHSSEIITDNVFHFSKGSTCTTNIRLSSLIGEGFDLRLVSKFIEHSLNNESIKIVGGKQVLSFMDVRDAAAGLIALLKTDMSKWERLYNLGNDEYYSITEIANKVKDISVDYTDNIVNIEVEEKDIIMETGMDSSLFYKDTGWRPEHSLDDSINFLFRHSISKKNYSEEE